jgi:exodeoxyribonuclease V beta subunit
VDWKSNTLGRRKESFYGDALKRAMYDATYPMQYLCYTAAAVRYLEHRLGQKVDEKLYDERFGGIYYIFLRGMTFNEPGGIFGARPPLSVVRNLLEALGCREGDVL